MKYDCILPTLKLAAVFCLGAVVNQNAMAQSSAVRNLAGTCANCHGIDGKAKDGMPSLAGRKAKEIATLLIEFRSGRRPSTIMEQISRGYTDAQIKLLSKYFSDQTKGAGN